MNIDLILGIVQIILIATTPLVFAGIGELVTEKSGVLNLGVEGMMLVGAVTAFVTLVITGSYILAFVFSAIPISCIAISVDRSNTGRERFEMLASISFNRLLESPRAGVSGK